MPFYEKGDVRIHYEEAGSGFPLLLIPGGGMKAPRSKLRGIKPPNPKTFAQQKPKQASGNLTHRD